MMWPFGNSRRSLEREVGRIMLANIEQRSALENPQVSLSSARSLAELFGVDGDGEEIIVTPATALSDPAVWGAVNFISGTIAALPAPVYKRTTEGREKDDNHPVYWLLHDWVNDDFLTSYAWRKYSMVNTLIYGRSFTFIEGKKRGRITNLWPLDPTKVTVWRINGRRRYKYRDGSREIVYDVDEIIDVPFMMNVDNLSAISPVETLKQTLKLSIALQRYASKFFERGGVPPLALQMPAGSSPEAHLNAAADLHRALSATAKERKLVLPMPAAHRLDPIAFKPQEGQLVEARKHQLREIARIYMLPPVFLQDLEFGTLSNTEQQDLILVKHTLTQWLRCWEQELNAKLFGPRSRNYIEFNVDGLLRGDFKSRMEALSKGIQNGLLTPNEGRAIENRPRSDLPDADKLHIQGATVPLGEQGKAAKLVADPNNDDNSDEEKQS